MRNKEIWKYIKDKDLFIDNVIEFFNNALGEILFIFWNGNWKDRLRGDWFDLKRALNYLSTKQYKVQVYYNNDNSPYFEFYEEERKE